MFFCRSLRHHFFSYHLDDLLSNDVIVKVKALQACNKLARCADLIFNSYCGLVFSIMLEEALQFLNFFEKSDGFYLSGSQ